MFCLNKNHPNSVCTGHQLFNHQCIIQPQHYISSLCVVYTVLSPQDGVSFQLNSPSPPSFYSLHPSHGDVILLLVQLDLISSVFKPTATVANSSELLPVERRCNLLCGVALL